MACAPYRNPSLLYSDIQEPWYTTLRLEKQLVNVQYLDTHVGIKFNLCPGDDLAYGLSRPPHVKVINFVRADKRS